MRWFKSSWPCQSPLHKPQAVGANGQSWGKRKRLCFFAQKYRLLLPSVMVVRTDMPCQKRRWLRLCVEVVMVGQTHGLDVTGSMTVSKTVCGGSNPSACAIKGKYKNRLHSALYSRDFRSVAVGPMPDWRLHNLFGHRKRWPFSKGWWNEP